MEDADLGWREGGPHRRDDDIDRGDGADLGRGTDAVVVDDFLHPGEWAVGEAETNTVVEWSLLDLPLEFLVLFGDLLMLLSGDEDLEVWALTGFNEILDDAAHEGVLAEHDLGLTEEVVADMQELSGVHVLGSDERALVVLQEEGLEAGAEGQLLIGDLLLVMHPAKGWTKPFQATVGS